jgi:hypothetical protein
MKCPYVNRLTVLLSQIKALDVPFTKITTVSSVVRLLPLEVSECGCQKFFRIVVFTFCFSQFSSNVFRFLIVILYPATGMRKHLPVVPILLVCSLVNVQNSDPYKSIGMAIIMVLCEVKVNVTLSLSAKLSAKPCRRMEEWKYSSTNS